MLRAATPRSQLARQSAITGRRVRTESDMEWLKMEKCNFCRLRKVHALLFGRVACAFGPKVWFFMSEFYVCVLAFSNVSGKKGIFLQLNRLTYWSTKPNFDPSLFGIFRIKAYLFVFLLRTNHQIFANFDRPIFCCTDEFLNFLFGPFGVVHNSTRSCRQ